MRVLFTVAVAADVAVAFAAVAVVAAAVVVAVNCRLWRQQLLKYIKIFLKNDSDC